MLKVTKVAEGTKVADVFPVMGGADPKGLAKFGDSASFRTPGDKSPVQRHRQKIKPNKPLKKRGFIRHESFVDSVVENALSEVVRKKGEKWAIYDNEDGKEIAVLNTRNQALQKQRDLKKQKRFTDQGVDDLPGKKGTGKAQNRAQGAQAPNVNKAKSIKAIKPIVPIKPIRPKGLKVKDKPGKKKKSQTFENSIVMSALLDN